MGTWYYSLPTCCENESSFWVLKYLCHDPFNYSLLQVTHQWGYLQAQVSMNNFFLVQVMQSYQDHLEVMHRLIKIFSACSVSKEDIQFLYKLLGNKNISFSGCSKISTHCAITMVLPYPCFKSSMGNVLADILKLVRI